MPAPPDEHERELAEAAYQDFYEDAIAEPIKYIKHDSRAHDDDALYCLVSDGGMAYLGWYWVLVELLAGRKGHYYDVSEPWCWKKLANDMSCMCPMSVEECQRFIVKLYELDLIISEQYEELHRVAIARMLRDAQEYARDVAGKKVGAWKTNRKKLLS